MPHDCIAKITGLLLLAAGAATTAIAQAEQDSALHFSGTLRARQEALDGQFRPGFDAHDDILLLRGSLRADWARGGWRLAGELIDSRAYDTDAGSVLSASDVNTFEPVQAYVQREFSAGLGAGSVAIVQAGRFKMNFGSRRLVSSGDDRNSTQAYTGLRAELHAAGGAQWTVFYTMPQQRRPDDFAALRDNDWALDHAGGDLRLWGAMAAQPDLLPGGLLAEIGYVGLKERDTAARPRRNRDLQNFSLRVIREAAAGSTDVELEGIYQTGTVRSSTAATAPQLNVNAWFMHAEIGRSFVQAWQPHLSLEADYASGDGPGAGYQRFDTLSGSRRSDLGPADIYGALARANLQAVGLRLEIRPTARLDAFGTWKLLWAANRHDTFSATGIGDASGRSGRRAGQQFDGRVRYWMVPLKLQLELNATWLLRGPLLRHAPNASTHGDTHFLAAAATYSF
jgi:hypothetical protein